ncbi:MAG: TIGR00730 family Rossman fold protein [Pseudomonadota bacterium]
MTTQPSVCVYCASSPGANSAFMETAFALGEALANAQLRLVYGGGDNGLMGAVARGALSKGGAVLGIIPEFLVNYEQSGGARNLEGAELITVPDMHTRKQRMFEEADAFIALPGGIGTLEELVEIMTWSQLRRHTKPVLVLDVDGFWQPLTTMMDAMETSGFLHNAERAKPGVFGSVEALTAHLVPKLVSKDP